MEKEDFRTVSDSIRSSYRKKAIGLINKGVKKGEIAILFGVNKNTIFNWVKHYKETGGFKSKIKGVKSEDKKLLSAFQEKAIQLMIIDKIPDQLKLHYALWTRKAVKELVEREFGIILAINTMGDYLRNGILRRKSRRKWLTSNVLKKFKNGWMKNILHFRKEQGWKQQKSNGETKRGLKIIANTVVLMLPKARYQPRKVCPNDFL